MRRIERCRGCVVEMSGRLVGVMVSVSRPYMAHIRGVLYRVGFLFLFFFFCGQIKVVKILDVD